jgi:hypothetical protein
MREVQVMVACYNTCRRARLAPGCDSLERKADDGPRDRKSHSAPDPSYGSKELPSWQPLTRGVMSDEQEQDS